MALDGLVTMGLYTEGADGGGREREGPMGGECRQGPKGVGDSRGEWDLDLLLVTCENPSVSHR